MKKYFAAIFFSLFIILSFNSFAQVDSARIRSTERQIAKDQKRANKLARKANKQERKRKRSENRMERKEKKRNRALNNVEKSQRKLEDLKRDSTRTSAIYTPYPLLPQQDKGARIYAASLFIRDSFYKVS